MKIVWDEPKREANIAKHGLDFADVVLFGWETALITTSHSNRFKAIGRFEDGTAVVIYAELGTEAISIISFRPASANERKLI
ncbi:MAG: BrnT family toxin [Rhizobiaceae bacterium]